MKLSPQAKTALDKVVNATRAYKVAKEGFELELQRELDEKLSSYVSDRNMAVVLADKAGVPRTQIGRAMGTTNYRTVQEILEIASDSIPMTESADKNWWVAEVENGYQLTINELGAGAVSGTATVRLVDGELEFIDGDPFVVPQVYRNNISTEIVLAIS